MTDQQGHLFIIHGDLSKLSCDGVLIPRDRAGNVSRWWFEMLQQKPSTGRPWEPLPAGARLRDTRWGPVAHELVDTESGDGDVGRLVRSVQDGLASLAARVGGSAAAGRVLPLLALPLPGTGHGGLQHRRGAVVHALVPRLVGSARELGVDLVLVAHDRRDFAALQSAREPLNPDLPPELFAEADRLGHLAAYDHLSVFAGAGLSVPLGLPGWAALVNTLLAAADLDVLPDGADEPKLLAGASRAKQALGGRYPRVLEAALDVQHHALGHGLVASLRARQNVTTNFDRALEVAMRTTHGDGLKVLTSQWAGQGAPWLLKLHGTAGDQDIVLTEEDYQKYKGGDGRPLDALVQGLLMTSHLLFVGFSLTDSNYLQLATPVADLYARAGGEDRVATALGLDSLANQERALDEAFDHISFDAKRHGHEVAARTLEIFLDRMVWSAARLGEEAHAYLLDERYADLVARQGQVQLKTALEDLRQALAGLDGSAASRARDQLLEFGARWE